MDAALKLKAEQLAGEIADQAHTLEDLNGLLRTLMKSALERMLDTEMDVHLGRNAAPALARNQSEAGDQSGTPNRRNGHSTKTIRGEMGELTLDTPRDRIVWDVGHPGLVPFIHGLCRSTVLQIFGLRCEMNLPDVGFKRTCADAIQERV